MSNRLKNQSSPYLQQHAENPVDWYPWCSEAFEKAEREDKPVFLSIGYSTCHWCHVMAHESFEDREIAEILNKHFISIKVDREERPDIDSVYMSVCQALTGSGGWPLSIFMTAEQKPFMAGTYFPRVSVRGMTGFGELLAVIADQWKRNRSELLRSADQILAHLNFSEQRTENGIDDRLPDLAAEMLSRSFDEENGGFGSAPKFPMPHNLLFLMLYAHIKKEEAARDARGREQSVPAGTQKTEEQSAPAGTQKTEEQSAPAGTQKTEEQSAPAGWENLLEQVKTTLESMRRGGIFDHIGYGFSRYSTDPYFLVPHFEKMLYDNALLIIAYAAAYRASGEEMFLDTAKETADYVLREMTGVSGEFYSAQDADSEGAEGKFYVWSYEEICEVLGEEKGKRYCAQFGITEQGNFEGKNIPNLLNGNAVSGEFEEERKQLYEYRKRRARLHLDDKILTSWNSLMISAMAVLYRVTGEEKYLTSAKRAQAFIERNLTEKNRSRNVPEKTRSRNGGEESNGENQGSVGNGTRLFVSYRDGMNSVKGFLDDYAYYAAALISLYEAASDKDYLERAQQICRAAEEQFADERGGYFLCGNENSRLITTPKETYDGALPSGNSVMAYCLVRLAQLSDDVSAGVGDTGEELFAQLLADEPGESERFPKEDSGEAAALTGSEPQREGKHADLDWQQSAERQLAFLSAEAEQYPAGYCMFLLALLMYLNPPQKIKVVPGAEMTGEINRGALLSRLPLYADVKILDGPTEEYRLLNNRTTYYVCKDQMCLPPSNSI